jgi:hypothetical protein
MRAYDDSVFTVDDPSLPYVTLPRWSEISDPAPCTNEGLHDRRPQQIYDLPSADRMGVVEHFRYMPVRHKVELLEYCISKERSDILIHISTLYATIGDAIYHLLWYRDRESSYTSLNIVPKKREGKTRCFHDGQWHTVSQQDEIYVFAEYNKVVEVLMSLVDSHPIYGIISAIDGGMRIRLRGAEDYSLSVKDHRYVRRGKSIKSIKKNMLMSIRDMLINNKRPDIDMSIQDIITQINTQLINMKLYAIV